MSCDFSLERCVRHRNKDVKLTKPCFYYPKCTDTRCIKQMGEHERVEYLKCSDMKDTNGKKCISDRVEIPTGEFVKETLRVGSKTRDIYVKSDLSKKIAMAELNRMEYFERVAIESDLSNKLENLGIIILFVSAALFLATTIIGGMIR